MKDFYITHNNDCFHIKATNYAKAIKKAKRLVPRQERKGIWDWCVADWRYESA